LEPIPQAHKVALKKIEAGTSIIRYNVTIGHALYAIEAGTWVKESCMRLPEAKMLTQVSLLTRAAQPTLKNFQEQFQTRTFMGYRNLDGSVGTRNLLAVSSTVQCVSGIVEFAVKRIRNELLPQFPNVDGVVSLDHTYGCGVAIDAPGAEIPIRTIKNLALNPNFGGEVLLVSLGCEKLQPSRLWPESSLRRTILIQPESNNESILGDWVCLQDEHHEGFMSMIDDIMERAKAHLQRLNNRRRECVPISELVVGVQCGGSDAMSGITANPTVGVAADLLVQAGATVMFSENTEVRDAVDQLTARAANNEVAQRIVNELDWYDQYLARGQVDRAANTTPGNKLGGLSNIVEKAMGSIVKSGQSPISHVLSPGEKLKPDQKGLVFAATPASDFICGTLQLAAGMNMHVFTTGRGTPYGLAECPVIKVATRTELAQRWHDLMDLNAGLIADGDESVETMGFKLVEKIIAVASGEQTWAERWGLANDLVLFNPAPVT
jgi:galactarate dehydratase